MTSRNESTIRHGGEIIKGTASIMRYSSVGTGQNGLMGPLSKGMGVNAMKKCACDEESRSLVRKTRWTRRTRWTRWKHAKAFED